MKTMTREQMIKAVQKLGWTNLGGGTRWLLRFMNDGAYVEIRLNGSTWQAEYGKFNELTETPFTTIAQLKKLLKIAGGI